MTASSPPTPRTVDQPKPYPDPEEDSAVGDLFRGIAVVAARDLRRQILHPGVLVAQFVQVAFFLLVYAVGFDGMIGSVQGVPFSAFVFPGIIAIQVVTLGTSSGLTYAFDRDFGALREMMVAPVPRLSLPLGKVAASTLAGTVQASVMLLASPLLGLRLTFGHYLLGVAAFALTGVVFGLAGVFAACVVRRVETLQAVVQLAMYPLLFLSGSVFLPGSGPTWLETAVLANPMTYAVDLARWALIGSAEAAVAPLIVDLAVLTGLVAVLLTGLRLKVGR